MQILGLRDNQPVSERIRAAEALISIIATLREAGLEILLDESDRESMSAPKVDMSSLPQAEDTVGLESGESQQFIVTRFLNKKQRLLQITVSHGSSVYYKELVKVKGMTRAHDSQGTTSRRKFRKM
jgi:predicted phage gp36 major capsid-like protein